MIDNITFENPGFLWLLLLMPIVALWYFLVRNRHQPTLAVSGMQAWAGKTGWLPKLKPILWVLRTLALAAMIVALARPQIVDENTRSKTVNGIDIIMALDVSASMLARDLEPNRLEATKKVAAQFIKERPGDRIGLVLYAAESYTKTPITTDQAVVLNSLDGVAYDGILENGTAIGMGLGTAVNRLKDSKALSKVIILLTDGVNNAGSLDPKIAGELAKKYGIKVYTIGIGSNGNALSPVSMRNGRIQYGMTRVEIDEELMKEIAATTNGKYFRATDNRKLQSIYAEIDQLEKTEIEEIKYVTTDEKFRPFLVLACGLLIVEILLRYTLFKSFI